MTTRKKPYREPLPRVEISEDSGPMSPVPEGGEGPGNVRPTEPIAGWRRLQETDVYGVPWRKWGPYLAERAWGTVREDYSADGGAWSYFPWDQAISGAYR